MRKKVYVEKKKEIENRKEKEKRAILTSYFFFKEFL